MTLLMMLVSVGTVAFNPPVLSSCELGGARIRSSAALSFQTCRVARDRRAKACRGRGCSVE